MNSECVFRSEHPDVVAWYERADVEWQAFRARLAEIKAQYPLHQLVMVGRDRLVGLAGERPGPAWRFVVKGGMAYWVPFRNHKKDPAVLASFRASVKIAPTPGMPDRVWKRDNITTGHGVIRSADGVLWCLWDVPANQVVHWLDEQVVPDLTMWSPAKLSEYYAAVGQ